jgi:hypothetical protein
MVVGFCTPRARLFMPETSIRTLERPVFVAADGRRARRLALGARAAAALVAIWALALAAGGVGFARLPALHPAAAARPGATSPVALRSHAGARGRGRGRAHCPAVRAAARVQSQPCRSVEV